jgi:hypothetical protein
MKSIILTKLTRTAIAFAASLFVLSPSISHTQEAPKMPEPTKEHQWLAQFVGEWESEAEVKMGPGTEPMKCKGTETVRQLGGFWIVAEGKGEVMGMKMQHLMTLGYDPEKKKYIGTWVDSMMGHMWKYEGTVDATGKIITLEAEGPNMMTPGKMTKFRDVTEFKSKDHRVMSSSMLMEDGKWVTFVTGDVRRKK